MSACPICGNELICEYEYRGEGYVEESKYDCPDGHYSKIFSYGCIGIYVFDKEFSFSYLTKRKALVKIEKNVRDYGRWKLKQLEVL